MFSGGEQRQAGACPFTYSMGEEVGQRRKWNEGGSVKPGRCEKADKESPEECGKKSLPS